MSNKLSTFLKSALATGLAAIAVISLPFSLRADFTNEFPSVETELNDIPGDMPLGRYIQHVSSNDLETVVTLTNGVLTVRGESVNIASPTKMVVVTNSTVEPPSITTNFYSTVYQDELTNTIVSATNALATVMRIETVTNIIDIGGSFVTNIVVQTNITHLAYLDDLEKSIRADDTKADKRMTIWEFYCEQVGVFLKMNYSPGAPQSSIRWNWEGSQSAGFYPSCTNIVLTYSGGTWVCLASNPLTEGYAKGALDDNPVVVDTTPTGSSNKMRFTFVPTNFTDVAFVVYSDYLDNAYVARTNLNSVASAIKDDNLDTINGIAGTLKDIRKELINIAGESGVHLSFRNVQQGDVLTIGYAETGGSPVIIDWGDGTGKQEVMLPTNHTYQASGDYEVLIQGAISEINHVSSRDGTEGTSWVSIGEMPNSKLTDIRFDPTVGIVRFGDYSFRGCNGLTSLSFVPSDVGLGRGCFSECLGLEYPTLPNGFTNVPIECFAGCRGMRSLVGLPSTIETIGAGAFSNCTSITSLVGLPEGLKTIEEYAFSNSGLETLNGFPGTLSEVSPYVFYGCNGLEDITILPSSVTNIREYAFANCQNISTASVPNSVENIGFNAFENFGYAKRTIVLMGDRTIGTVTNMANFVWGAESNNVDFVCLDGSVTFLDNRMVASYITTILYLENVADNKTFSFGGLADNIQIDWNSSGTRTTSKTHTYGLATNHKITIYGKLGTIGASGGRSWLSSQDDGTCTNLVGIEFGNGVDLTRLGDYAFYGCNNITNLDFLPATITTIGNHCFQGCTGLSDVSGLGKTSIGFLPAYCFSGCTSITNINGITSQIENIGDFCFSGCSNLSDLSELSNSLHIVSFGAGTFSGCSAITSLSFIPSSVSSIGINCFENCIGIQDLIGFPTGLSAIPQGCFYGCSGLKSLEGLSPSLQSVGASAFAGCISITNIIFIQDFQDNAIGANAFQNTGRAAEQHTDEDNHVYRMLMQFPNMSGESVKTLLANADVYNETKIVCANDAYIVWVQPASGSGYWAVEPLSLIVSLSSVPNGTVVRAADIIPEEGSTLMINWGDGAVQEGVTDSRNLYHKYDSGGDQTIKVRGFVQSIGASLSQHPFIYMQYGTETINTNLTDVTVISDLDAKAKGEYGGISSLGEYCFAGCENLETLSGLSATANTRSNKRAIRSKRAAATKSSITSIGRNCFAGCTRLRSLEGLPSVAILPESCFENCSSLPNLDGLPKTITSLGSACFSGCVNLDSISAFPTNAVSVPENCFRNCEKLRNINGLSTKVTDIEDYGFYNCTNLNSLSGMNNAVLGIGEGAFSSTSITNLEGISTNLSTISARTFRDCTKLVCLSGIEKSKVRSVGEGAFLSCTNLFSIEALPTNIVYLGGYSFAQCSSLTNGRLGRAVSIIGENSFMYSGANFDASVDESGLLARTRIDSTSIWCDEMIGRLNMYSNVNAYIEYKCRDGYVMNIEGTWKAFKKRVSITMENIRGGDTFYVGSIIPEEGSEGVEVDWGDGTSSPYSKTLSHTYQVKGTYTVSFLGFIDTLSCTATNTSPILYRAGGGNTNITSISFGDMSHVKTLGSFCFMNCKNLNSLEGLSSSMIQTMGTNCFLGCAKLTSLQGLPSSLSTLGYGNFAECTGLSSLEGLPSTITELPSMCFAGCIGLSSLTNFSPTISTIGEMCFKGCTGLRTLEGMGNQENVVLADGVFMGCTGLSSLKGFNTNSTLSASCFADCTGLLSLEGMPSAISTIPEGCFRNCISLSSLLGMAESCQVIEYYAFSNCVGIVSLEGCSTNLTTISGYVFVDCSITNLDGVSSLLFQIGDFAFAENKQLTDLSGLRVCTNDFFFGEGCFYGCERLGTNNVVQSLPPNTKHIGTKAFAECTCFDVSALPEAVSEIGYAAFSGCWMRSLSEFPTNCPYVTSNLFERTSLFDTTIYITDPIMLWEDCFVDERDLEVFILDTFDTTRIVRLPNIACKTLESSVGFPFGASKTTRFVCLDGFVINVSNVWRSIRKSIELTFDVSTIFENSYYEYIPPGGSGLIPRPNMTWTTNYLNTIYIQGIKPHNNGLLHIDFGDNTKTNIFADDRVTHTYATTGTYEIAVYGEFDIIGTKNRFVGIEVEQFQTYVASYTSYDHKFFDLAGSISNKISSLYVLPASNVKEIGESAFDGLGDIGTFEEIPPTVEKIGGYAYRDCTNMNGVVTIPSNVVSIGEGAFRACKSISNVIIDSPVLTNLPNYVFADCTNLYSLTFSQENNLLSIGDYILQGAPFKSKVLDLSLCTNIQSIAAYSVFGSTYLNSMILYRNIDKINADFSGTSKLFTITMLTYQCEDIWRILEFPNSGPNNKWNLQKNTSINCIDGEIVSSGFHWEVRYGTNRIKLTNIKSNDTYMVSHVVSDGTFSIDWGDGTVTENISKVADHVSHTYTNDWEHTIVRLRPLDGSSIIEVAGTPEGLPMVYKDGASVHTNITEVFLDNSVKNIGDNCFRGYSLMTSFPINSSSTCTNIGDYAFAGCISLTTFIPPCKSSSLSLGSNILDGCYQLNGYSINLQYGVFPSMQTNTFEGISSINIYTYLYVENILEKVPQGCLLGGVSIRCRDGEVYYEDGQKKTFLPTIEVIIEVPEKTTISLGFPDAYRNKNVNGFITGPYYLGPPIDWGDPRTDVWSRFMAQETYSQYYRHAGIYKIRIFAGNMSGNTPILTHDGLSSRSVLNKRGDESGYGYQSSNSGSNPPPEPNFPMIYGYEVPINHSIVINIPQKPTPTVGIPDVSSPARTLPGKFHNGKYDSPDDPKNYTAFVSDMRFVKKIIFNKDSISPGFGDWCFANSQMDHIEVESFGRTLSVGKGCFANSDISDVLGKHVATDTAKDYEFYGCKNITRIDSQLGELYHVGFKSFMNSGLTSLVGWQESDTAIPESAFENTMLYSLEGMPNSVEDIGRFAFRNTPIRTVDGMSTNVVKIQLSAFYNSTNLVSTKGLSKKLETIESWAFAGTSNLKLIEMPNDNVSFCFQSFYADRADDKYALGGSNKHIFMKFPNNSIYSIRPNIAKTTSLYPDGRYYGVQGNVPAQAYATYNYSRAPWSYDHTIVIFCDDGIFERRVLSGDYISSPIITAKMQGTTETIMPGLFKTYDTRKQLFIDWDDGSYDFYDTDDMIAIENSQSAFKSHIYQDPNREYKIKVYGYVKSAGSDASRHDHGRFFYPPTNVQDVSFTSDTCLKTIGSNAFKTLDGRNLPVRVSCLSTITNSAPRIPLPEKAAQYTTKQMKLLPVYPFGSSLPTQIFGVDDTDKNKPDLTLYLRKVPAGTSFAYTFERITNEGLTTQVTIDWGDGTPVENWGDLRKRDPEGPNIASHIYKRGGEYMITVRMRSRNVKSITGSYCRPLLYVTNRNGMRGSNPYLWGAQLINVTHINNFTFYGCNNLTSLGVDFPNSLKHIGDCAFEGTGITRFPNLLNAPPPQSSVVQTLNIGSNAFETASGTVIWLIERPINRLTISPYAFGTIKPWRETQRILSFNGTKPQIMSKSGFPFAKISDIGFGQKASINDARIPATYRSSYHETQYYCVVDIPGWMPQEFYFYPVKISGDGDSAVYEWRDRNYTHDPVIVTFFPK